MTVKALVVRDDPGAVDANTIALGVNPTEFEYPKTFAGVTAGVVSGGGSGLSAPATGNANPLLARRMVAGIALPEPIRIRIDRAAGTFPVKIWDHYASGDNYRDSAVTVYDTDGTTVLFQRVNRYQSAPAESAVITNGSLVAVASAGSDAGQSITTTGNHFFVTVEGNFPGSAFDFPGSLASFQWEDGTGGAPNPRVGFAVVSGYPALSAIPNNATLVPPLVLQAVDAGNAPTTAGVGDTVTIGIEVVITGATVVSGGTAVQAADGTVTFSSLVLAPVTNLTGTATRSAVAGVATLDDLRVRFQ